jgi:hypothetical protein
MRACMGEHASVRACTGACVRAYLGDAPRVAQQRQPRAARPAEDVPLAEDVAHARARQRGEGAT